MRVAHGPAEQELPQPHMGVGTEAEARQAPLTHPPHCWGVVGCPLQPRAPKLRITAQDMEIWVQISPPACIRADSIQQGWLRAWVNLAPPSPPAVAGHCKTSGSCCLWRAGGVCMAACPGSIQRNTFRSSSTPHPCPERPYED